MNPKRGQFFGNYIYVNEFTFRLNDETYIGGKEANKHERKNLKAGRGVVGKTAVLGMRERGGKMYNTNAREST